MNSVVKFRRVAGLADLHGVNFFVHVQCLKLWFGCCDFGSIFPLFGRFNFISMDGWCFSFGIVSFSRCYAFLFTGILFYIARHLAAEFGTRLAAPSVYVTFAGGG
jgi:hypothetical protein